MKRWLALVFLLLVSINAAAQSTAPVQSDVQRIQAVTEALIWKRGKAVVLLTDLLQIAGHVTFLEADAFVLSADKKGSGPVRIRYAEVLGIASDEGSVSLIPDPKTTPYGEWKHLQKLSPNTLIEITDENGEVTAGRFRSWSPDALVLAHKENGTERALRREGITFIHRVKYGVRNFSDGMAGGADKGGRVGKEVGSAAGGIRGPISGQPTGDGRGSTGQAMGAGVGALIGMAKGAVNKSGSVRVLVYSR